MLQYFLVALIVAAAIGFSTWKLMPARWRLRCLLALDGWAASRPAFSGWRERSLKPRIARAAGTGCGGCAEHTARPPRSLR